MKKFLLSFLCLLACAAVSRAEVVLNVSDASDFEGTLHEQTLNADGSTKAAQHYQPLESLVINGFTFSFSTSSDKENQAPAYYWGTEKNPDVTIRLYTGSTMTITAPAGTTMTSINFDGANGGSGLEPTADTGSLAFKSNKATWNGSASTVSVTVNASWRLKHITVFTDGEDNPSPVAPAEPEQPSTPSDPSVPTAFTYSLASSIESGKTYALFACDSVATAISANKTYGYLYCEAVTEEDGIFTAPASAGFTFDAAEGGFNIKDANGKYLYQTGTYNSFNLTDDPATEGALWSISVAADGTATITNVAMKKTIMFGKGYHSFGSYDEANDSRVLPAIYLQGEASSSEPTKPEEPEQPTTGALFELATSITSGSQYVMVIGEQYGAPIAESFTYGRLSLTDVVIADNKLTAPAEAAITITDVDGKGYTLTDTFGRFLAMDDSHLTSFQLYTELDEGCYWNAETVDGAVKFTNILNPSCIICQSGTYTNIAPAQEPETFQLPKLYVKSSASIGSVVMEAPADGTARYYDLQGRIVSSDCLTPGLYIRRQGNKAVKVIIR